MSSLVNSETSEKVSERPERPEKLISERPEKLLERPEKSEKLSERPERPEKISDIKTRRQLLREKVNNLAKFCINLKPEKAAEILKFKNQSEEEIVIWIVQSLLPRRNELGKFVDEWIKSYEIENTEEIKNKLLKYCQFFIKFLDK